MRRVLRSSAERLAKSEEREDRDNDDDCADEPDDAVHDLYPSLVWRVPGIRDNSLRKISRCMRRRSVPVVTACHRRRSAHLHVGQASNAAIREGVGPAERSAARPLAERHRHCAGCTGRRSRRRYELAAESQSPYLPIARISTYSAGQVSTVAPLKVVRKKQACETRRVPGVPAGPSPAAAVSGPVAMA